MDNSNREVSVQFYGLDETQEKVLLKSLHKMAKELKIMSYGFEEAVVGTENVPMNN